jgi:predicted PurR-regulated permease PerM
MTMRRQLMFWGIAAVVLLAIVFLLRSILLPFVAGLAVAYFLDPAVDWVVRRRAPWWLATSAVTAAFFLLLGLVTILLLPLVQGQVEALARSFPAYVAKVQTLLLPLVDRVLANFPLADADGPGDAGQLLTENAVRVVGNLFSRLLSSGLVLFNLLSLIFITPVVTFYMLRDWDRIVAKVDSWLPRQHLATIHEQVGEIDRVLAGFLRGQALVCLILAVVYGVALSLAGLQFGLVIGIFTGLVAFIPYVGFVLGFAVALIFAFLQFGGDVVSVGIIVAIYAVLQVVESMALTPKLVGSRVGLHPVWIIFALLAAGVLFGVVGILLAVPVAAVIGVLIRFGVSRYLASQVYLGPAGSTAEPAPDDEKEP